MLDERLQSIYDMVPPSETIADIGTDHGYLARELLETGRAQRAILTDISPDSLAKARKLMADHVLEERCVFSVGDGCAALPEKPDTAVIAGMGGMLIARIIREGIEKLRGARLILQPNIDMAEVRKTLSENGYAVIDENIAFAAGRHYVIIAAEPGEAQYSLEELEVGPVLLKKGARRLASFARFRIKVLEKALIGAQKGIDRTAEQDIQRQIALWQEIEKREEAK